MADSCKLHSPASARPRRGNTTQVEYPDGTRCERGKRWKEEKEAKEEE